jgi:hypothetical protein
MANDVIVMIGGGGIGVAIARIVPIPGIRKLHRFEENVAATDLEDIAATAAGIEVQGARGTGHEAYG